MVTASRGAIEEATHSKWKSEEERSTVTAPVEGSEMMSLVRAWQNPNFKHVTDVPTAVAAVPNKGRLSCGAVRFKRSMLRGLSVVGQVDKKFIAATMPHEVGDRSRSGNLLVLFDQHAVHERIRLETLIKGQPLLKGEQLTPLDRNRSAARINCMKLLMIFRSRQKLFECLAP